MNFAWVVLVTSFCAVAGTGLCFWLLNAAREARTTVWILRHILCPIVRIVVLLIIVSQVYPVIDDGMSNLEFWRVLGRQGQFNDLINFLFVLSLALGFIPLLNHPVTALPLQGMLTVALVFHWQYASMSPAIELIPQAGTLLKILLYMLLAYFFTRETSIRIARRIDHELVVSGSIRLVSEAIYLVLQIPVILIYCGFLGRQLT